MSITTKAGANFSTRQYVYKGQVDGTQYDFVKGFQIGSDFEYELNAIFSLTGGILFGSRGYTSFTTIIYINGYKSPPDTTNHHLEYKHHLYYSDLPLNLKFKYPIDVDVFFFGKTGIYLGYGVAGTSTQFDIKTDSTGIYFTPETGNYNLKQSNEPRFDFGVSISFGIEYRRFFFEATYMAGVRNLANKNATDIVTRNKSTMLNLGYRIAL